MPDPEASQAPPKAPNPQLERFLRGFEESVQSADRIEKAAEAVIAQIAHEQNGLIPAVDDLIDEIRGLREDLRAVCAAGGMRVPFIRMKKI